MISTPSLFSAVSITNARKYRGYSGMCVPFAMQVYCVAFLFNGGVNGNGTNGMYFTKGV